jgi:hypothetical protein
MWIRWRVYRHTRRCIGSQQAPLEGYSRSVTSISFSFISCLKTTLIYSPNAFRKHLIRVSSAPRFSSSSTDSRRVELLVRVSLVCPSLPCLSFTSFRVHHSFIVTSPSPDLSPFFILLTYICVLILLHMCAHMCVVVKGSSLVRGVHMCPHTTLYVCAHVCRGEELLPRPSREI